MTLRIGSWHASGKLLNDFIAIYSSSLRDAGVDVVGVPDPLALDPRRPDIDVLQIHWAEMVFRDRGRWEGIRAAWRVLRAVRKLRRRGVKVTWMVHNLKPHDMKAHRRPIWNWYARRLARMVDGVMTLSPATLPIVRQAFPFRADVAQLALRHPAYCCAARLPFATQRARFSIPDGPLSLVYAGIVRPYKGVDELARCIGRLAPEKRHLTIAGLAPDPRYRATIQALADAAPNVTFRPGRIDEATFEALLASADYVVLPFADTLHSGSIVHALSMGRAVVTPTTPYARDLQQHIGVPWLHLHEPSRLEETLVNLPPPPSGIPDLSCLSAQDFGRSLSTFYHTLVRPDQVRGTTSRQPSSIPEIAGPSKT